MEIIYSSPRAIVAQKLRRGDASRYIRRFDILRPDDPVVLWVRVSALDGNELQREWSQELFLRRELKRRGAKIVGVIPHTGSGWMHSGNPWYLSQAARHCRLHGAALVALTPNRFVRSPFYPRVSFRAQATEDDLQELEACTRGVTLVTYTDPTATDSEERSALIKAGRAITGNRGGRPKSRKPGHCIRRRQRLRPEAQALHQQGESYRRIAAILDVPLSTVRRWTQN